MNPWNQGQRMAGSHQQPRFSQNTNLSQNYFGTGNLQHFYPGQQGIHSHPAPTFPVHQPRGMFPRNMNPMQPGHIVSGQGQQVQPVMQFSLADTEEMKKKRHFEDQQRRLMALKQKGGQAPGKIQVDNPLNDLFGKKAPNSATSSLLGALGDAAKPRNSSVGLSVASDFPVEARAVTSNANIGSGQSSNWNVQGVSSHATSLPAGQQHGMQVGHTEQQFLNFPQKKGQEDFGDFQVSATSQAFPNPSSTGTSSCTIPTTSDTLVGSSKPDGHPQTKISSMPNKQPVAASASPSIEELMKKSLSLDNQPQGPAKQFQKPKLPKMMKSEPVHFTESAKASKWDNLESLSDVFTIPQQAVNQPEQSFGTQMDVVNTSGDDWSDFSGADHHTVGGMVFQGNGTTPSSSLVQSGVPSTNNPEISRPPQLSGTSGVALVKSESIQTGSQQHPIPGSGLQNTELLVSGTPGPSQLHEHHPEGTSANEQFAAMTDTQGVDDQEMDPDQQIYGVKLPGWSKKTNSLPVIYKQVYKICSMNGDGISTSQLYPILLSSDLPRDKLGHIWSQCNKAVLGQLNEQELYLILGMVALAQVGLQLSKLTLGKLASCTTPPIPSFPEHIFQNDKESVPSVQTSVSEQVEEKDKMQFNNDYAPTLPQNSGNQTKHIDAVKQPDWSKWKTSKAANIDDKFKDFQTLVPKDRSDSFQEQVPLSNLDTAFPLSHDPPRSTAAFASGPHLPNSFPQSNELTASIPALSTTENASSVFMPGPSQTLGEDFGTFQTCSGQPPTSTVNTINTFESHQSSTTDTNDAAFGDFTSASLDPRKDNFSETKMPGNLMSVSLAQRYMLSPEDENVDQNENAWLKCLTSCFTVITRSYQVLQTVTDPQLMDEIFTSQQGISHFSAIIEIYSVSQRIKASVLKSAPNSVKLKEALQNIDNIWKTCLGFQSFKALLPTQSLDFSGFHVNDNEDLNLACGVCLLNVDKSWVNSLVNNGRSGKLSYGSRFYHTTCANFWCNKVDSVLPSLQLNVGNSFI